TRTHFEQIFMLYEDREQRIDRVLDEIAEGTPYIELSDEYGVVHTLWIVDRPELLRFIQIEMAEKELIIADGHHRYETALAYRNEMRASEGTELAGVAYEKLPMAFFNMHSPGLTILPTHRVVSRMAHFDSARMLDRASGFFEITDAPSQPEEFRSELRRS